MRARLPTPDIFDGEEWDGNAGEERWGTPSRENSGKSHRISFSARSIWQTGRSRAGSIDRFVRHVLLFEGSVVEGDMLQIEEVDLPRAMFAVATTVETSSSTDGHSL